MKNCLVLVQHRDEKSSYNDFVGKFYHFPGNQSKSYLRQFDKLPIEFVYYEPTSNGGQGEYFGYGIINKKPFADKREEGFYFVEVDEYKPFAKPVPYKDTSGELIEKDNPHYNSQNAVRKIPPKLLEEVCLDGEIQLNFKADAHLIKVLGEQLIASEKVGVLELIKNAYDAHATECVVKIEKSPDLPKIDDVYYTYPELPGPVILIEDNGTGMSREALEKGWLRPASTIKTNIKEQLKEERKKALEKGSLASYESLVKELKKANHNRIPLGEKGVGRFATHRLGQYLIIKTKIADLDYEYLLEIDWNLFDKYSDKGIDLQSIGVSLKRQAPSRSYGPTNSGTQIIIYGGKEEFEWNERQIRDLNRSILQLNSPNPNPEAIKNVFHAKLEAPQVLDLQTSIDNAFTPSFEFFGLVDEQGVMDYTLSFTPPRSEPMTAEETSDTFDLKSGNKLYWNERSVQRTECGPFYIHLKLWYRRKPWVSGPESKDFLNLLESFGGIAIYRDGINIFPAEWGAQNDWLGLSKEHVKQGDRFSYYNMLGNIEIDQGNNLNLTDKTNREGLIENKAYRDMQELLKVMLGTIVLQKWRGKRDEHTKLTKDIVRDPKVLKEYAKQSLGITTKIQENYPVEKDPFDILGPLGNDPVVREEQIINLNRSLKAMQDSLKLIEESQEMLTEQAGYGLAIASSVHEINKITSNFYHGINEVLKKEKFDPDRLIALRDSSSSLRSELKRLAPLRALRNEQKQEMKISRPISYALDVYRSRLTKLNVKIEFDKQQDFQIYARYGAIVQIFTNLIDNAYYWIDTVDTERRITIKIDSKYRTVVFADTGPGIHDSMMPHLFKPGYSMKIPPSGLGLYISKHYMQDMKGDLQLLANPKFRIEDMPGAQFLLDFQKVKESKV